MDTKQQQVFKVINRLGDKSHLRERLKELTFRKLATHILINSCLVSEGDANMYLDMWIRNTFPSKKTEGLVESDDGSWVTINGAHVKVDGSGNVISGGGGLGRIGGSRDGGDVGGGSGGGTRGAGEGRGTHIDQTNDIADVAKANKEGAELRSKWLKTYAGKDTDNKKRQAMANELQAIEKPALDKVNANLESNRKTQNEFYRGISSKDKLDDYMESGLVRNKSAAGESVCFSTDPKIAGKYGNIRMVFDADSMRDQVKPVKYQTTVDRIDSPDWKYGMPLDFAGVQELRSHEPVKAKIKRVEYLQVGDSSNDSTLSAIKAAYPKLDIRTIDTTKHKEGKRLDDSDASGMISTLLSLNHLSKSELNNDIIAYLVNTLCNIYPINRAEAEGYIASYRKSNNESDNMLQESKHTEPLHPDFQRILSQFIARYGKEDGTDLYYAWLKKRNLDDTKPYSTSQIKKKEACTGCTRRLCESIDAFKPLIRLLKQDTTGKTYEIEAHYADTSMNNVLYTRDEVRQAASTMPNKHIDLNHKVPDWIIKGADILASSVVSKRLEACEGIKTFDYLVCLVHVNNGTRDPKGRDVQQCITDETYHAVSVEVTADDEAITEGGARQPIGMQYEGLAFLDQDALPGFPLTRITTLESIMDSAFDCMDSSNQEVKKNERKRTRTNSRSNTPKRSAPSTSPPTTGTR